MISFPQPRDLAVLRHVSQAFRSAQLLADVSSATQQAAWRGRGSSRGAADSPCAADLDFLATLPSLRSLCLYRSSLLLYIHHLPRLTELQVYCRHDLDVTPLTAVLSLGSLHLHLTTGTPLNLAALAPLSGLTSLRLTGNTSSALPAGVHLLTNLRSLRADDCTQASQEFLRALSSLQALTHLAFSLDGLPVCFQLPHLQQLGLAFNSHAALASLSSLAQLTKLELELWGQASLDVVALSEVRQLRSLSLIGWQMDLSLQLPALRVLRLSQLESELQIVDLVGCGCLCLLELQGACAYWSCSQTWRMWSWPPSCQHSRSLSTSTRATSTPCRSRCERAI